MAITICDEMITPTTAEFQNTKLTFHRTTLDQQCLPLIYSPRNLAVENRTAPMASKNPWASLPLLYYWCSYDFAFILCWRPLIPPWQPRSFCLSSLPLSFF